MDQEEAEPPPGQEQVLLPGNLKTEGRPGGSDRGPVQMEELDLKQQLLDTSCKLEIESHRSGENQLNILIQPTRFWFGSEAKLTS